MKLYDNGHLTVVDAAMQAGWDTDELFPRRGKEIHYTVNGVAKMIRGEEGESAVVKMNDTVVGLNTPLEPNSYITIEASTEGGKASSTIEQLDEFTSATVSFFVCGKQITCPKFVEVNGSLEPGSYKIKDGDVIETRSFYSVGQIAEFMDVEIDDNYSILVNNREADKDTLVYENFNVDWTVTGYGATEGEGGDTIVGGMTKEQVDEAIENINSSPNTDDTISAENNADPLEIADSQIDAIVDDIIEDSSEESYESTEPDSGADTEADTGADADSSGEVGGMTKEIPIPLNVIVNNEEVTLTGKSKYVFVDVFDVIDFDTRDSRGRAIVTLINGNRCGYSDVLKAGDRIEIYWQEIRK